MLINFYKQYLRRFPLVRRLRWLVGRTRWAVRWQVIHPAKVGCARLLRKMKSFVLDCGFFLARCFSSARARLFSSPTAARILSGVRRVFIALREKVLRPLARRFIPRHIRTKLLAYDVNKLLRFFGGARELPLMAFGNAVDTGRAQPGPALYLEERVVCCEPMVVPPSLDPIVALAAESYIFPAIAVALVPNAKVEGLSNFVELKDEVLHHDLYRLSHDYTSEELHGRFTIHPAENRIRKFGRKDSDLTLDTAAVFTDACAPNYAHWLTEVLPRIHVCAQSGMDDSIPFIVDAGLHANILASARLLAGKHPLLELTREQSIQVKNLYVVGATGYIPFDRRPAKDGDHGHGIFSASALRSMRTQLSQLLGAGDGTSPRKIMLRRSSGARAMRNEEALALKLEQLGFSLVYPETLSFTQQYQLFSKAECVVGATGAAMANLVFCPTSCRIVICLSSHREHSFGYWRNMASAVGNEIRYVLGPVLGEKNQGVHADFVVSVDDVLIAINN